MPTGVLAFVEVSPESVAALTAEGYAVSEVVKYPSAMMHCLMPSMA
jgi:hypothetical protein